MLSLAVLIDKIIDIYTWIVIASAIMSWLVAFGVVNVRNQFIRVVVDLLFKLTEPVLRPIRRMLPISAASTSRPSSCCSACSSSAACCGSMSGRPSCADPSLGPEPAPDPFSCAATPASHITAARAASRAPHGARAHGEGALKAAVTRRPRMAKPTTPSLRCWRRLASPEIDFRDRARRDGTREDPHGRGRCLLARDRIAEWMRKNG